MLKIKDACLICWIVKLLGGVKRTKPRLQLVENGLINVVSRYAPEKNSNEILDHVEQIMKITGVK